jgi:hypothetical protein
MFSAIGLFRIPEEYTKFKLELNILTTPSFSVEVLWEIVKFVLNLGTSTFSQGIFDTVVDVTAMETRVPVG